MPRDVVVDRPAIAHELVASGFLRRMLNALDLSLADGALAPWANAELGDGARGRTASTHPAPPSNLCAA